MSSRLRIRRALVSVSDKTDLVPFVRGLLDCGVETIVSTGGTARTLADAGIPVTSVESLTGFPEMMDGRVKTLHPAVHGALLARRDDPAHVAAMDEHGIEPIDLVCVNLYPFEQTIARGDVSADEAIEQIDIGGPAVIRSASKNHASVAVVTDIGQYDDVIAELKAEGGLSHETRRTLASAAFMRTAAYDTAISAWMGGHAQAPEFPSVLQLTYSRERTLRYGENPHQAAAVYADPATADASVVTADVLGGRPLSYNNMLDASAAVRVARDLAVVLPDRVAAAVIKHTNPCGAATGDTAIDAFRLAYEGDPVAAYGGILAVAAPLDEAAARAIADGGTFLEVIAAPSIDDGAQKVLHERWKNVRLLQVAGMDRLPERPIMEYRAILGGLLVQTRDDKAANRGEWQHVAGPAPDEAMLHEAVTAWTVVKHVSSNAIAITRDGRLIGVGGGQVDRVTAAGLAVDKARERLVDAGGPAVAASDAFFPFPDGPQRLIDAGVRCLVHPGGSKRDGDTHAVCNEHGVTCIHTGYRHFRH